MADLDDIRLKYAEEIRRALKLRFGIDLSQPLVGAFAKVPRESFLGPPPWLVRRANKNRWQRFACWLYQSDQASDWITAEPRYLYQPDAIVAIDPDRGLNNGQPSGLASWIHFLELHEGACVLHVGCGVGYYTAIMAEVVGPTGRVVGIEIDRELALRARKNLAYLDQVEVVHGNGGEYAPGPSNAILVNAGATHPTPAWLDSLAPGGRMIVPLTTENERGALLNVRAEPQGYSARFIFTAQIFHCAGGRNEELNQSLEEGFKSGAWKSVQSLRRESHELNDTCWLHAKDFCLSGLPVSTD